jgi:hypothetical protein
VPAQTVALRVVQTLRMRARRGKVESVTRAKGVSVWRIPEKQNSAVLLGVLSLFLVSDNREEKTHEQGNGTKQQGKNRTQWPRAF